MPVRAPGSKQPRFFAHIQFRSPKRAAKHETAAVKRLAHDNDVFWKILLSETAQQHYPKGHKPPHARQKKLKFEPGCVPTCKRRGRVILLVCITHAAAPTLPTESILPTLATYRHGTDLFFLPGCARLCRKSAGSRNASVAQAS